MKKPVRRGYAQGGRVTDPDSSDLVQEYRPTPADTEAATRAYNQGKTRTNLPSGGYMKDISVVGKARGGKVRKVTPVVRKRK